MMIFSIILCATILDCSHRLAVIKIQTEPSGARVQLDSVELALETPVTLESISVGSHRLVISHLGFVTLDTSIVVSTKDTLSLWFSLDRRIGKLSLSTTPPSVFRVFSSTTYIPLADSVTPASVEILPGDYRVLLSSGPCFDSVWLDATIELGQETRLDDITLQSNCANVRIRTQPPGCAVKMNDSLISTTTPVEFDQVPLGHYHITLIHDSKGYDLMDTLVLIDGGEVVLDFELVRIISRVRMLTEPDSALVEIKSWRSNSYKGCRFTPFTLELQPGQYDLMISKPPFYLPRTESVKIIHGEQVDLTMELEPHSWLAENFVRVPAGEFLMGNDKGARDEGPAHMVDIDEFWIGKHEVTAKEFQDFLKSSDYKEYKYEACSDRTIGLRVRENHPVNYVSWRDASVYAVWLSKQCGLPCRLPTEAEWEKAARGTDSRTYPWGNEWTDGEANFCDASCKEPGSSPLYNDGFPTTSPSGALAGDKSPYGAFDMAGNVSEWCMDAYCDTFYRVSEVLNPLYQGNALYRVVRGGDWNDNRERLEASYRKHREDTSRSGEIGFRIVVSARH